MSNLHHFQHGCLEKQCEISIYSVKYVCKTARRILSRTVELAMEEREEKRKGTFGVKGFGTKNILYSCLYTHTTTTFCTPASTLTQQQHSVLLPLRSHNNNILYSCLYTHTTTTFCTPASTLTQQQHSALLPLHSHSNILHSCLYTHTATFCTPASTLTQQ